MNNPYEVILRVSAEGGTLGILGRRESNGTWSYVRETEEALHADLLGEEERKGLVFQGSSDSVATISEAIVLLKNYPWHRLHPMDVHPEFSQAIFDEVFMRYHLEKADDAYNLTQWKECCGIPSES